MVFADITIVPVPSERKAAYLQFSKRMAVVYRDHGATSVLDYWQSHEARERGTIAATQDPRVLKTMDEDPVFDAGRVVGESFDLSMALQDDE